MVFDGQLSNALTWLIFEVEDGHYVIRKIKDGKHSHFGESLGKIAQIKNCQYVFHRASPMSCGSLWFFLCIPTAQSGKEAPQTGVHRLSTEPPGLDLSRL